MRPEPAAKEATTAGNAGATEEQQGQQPQPTAQPDAATTQQPEEVAEEEVVITSIKVPMTVVPMRAAAARVDTARSFSTPERKQKATARTPPTRSVPPGKFNYVELAEEQAQDQPQGYPLFHGASASNEQA